MYNKFNRSKVEADKYHHLGPIRATRNVTAHLFNKVSDEISLGDIGLIWF